MTQNLVCKVRGGSEKRLVFSYGWSRKVPKKTRLEVCFLGDSGCLDCMGAEGTAFEKAQEGETAWGSQGAVSR